MYVYIRGAGGRVSVVTDQKAGRPPVSVPMLPAIAVSFSLGSRICVWPALAHAPISELHRSTSLMRNHPPWDPTVGLCLGSYGDPRRGTLFLMSEVPLSPYRCYPLSLSPLRWAHEFTP